MMTAVLGAVNFSEVLAVAHRYNLDCNVIRLLLIDIFHVIIPFDEEQAYISASLYNVTKQYGLSFGDRACLGLASHKGYAVITADKIWKELNLGIEIYLIR